MFKTLTLVILYLFAANAYACFQPPDGLIESHVAQAKLYFLLAVVLLMTSLVLRLISDRNRIWVPLLFVTTYTYFPAYIWHWGQVYSGACGIPEIVLAFQIWSGGLAGLCTYEAIYLFKVKCADATKQINKTGSSSVTKTPS